MMILLRFRHSLLSVRRRLLRTALGATIQVDFHKTWKEELTAQVLTDITLVRAHFPSYFTITTHAIAHLPPGEIGKMFSVIRCCAVALSIFLLQSPNPEATSSYCADLWGYVVDRCPNTLVQGLDMVELSVLLQHMLDEEYGAHGSPGRMSILDDMFPLHVDRITGQGSWFNSAMTRRITFAIVLEHRPCFRERMSKVEYFGVGRGFRQEEFRQGKALPLFEVDSTDDDEELEEAELELMGEPVPLMDFCQPATAVLEGEACSVCTEEVGVEGKDAVVTKCLHFFHQECLNKWVNRSCMDGSNACPTCRAEMCRERERRLVDDTGLERLSQEEGEADSESERRTWQRREVYQRSKKNWGGRSENRTRISRKIV
jgi:hypothetical protein